VILAPPFDTGFVTITRTKPNAAVTELILGAPATVNVTPLLGGATATVNGTPDIATLAAPLPAEFTARIIT
jgi:hypothetical protein